MKPAVVIACISLAAGVPTAYQLLQRAGAFKDKTVAKVEAAAGGAGAKTEKQGKARAKRRQPAKLKMEGNEAEYVRQYRLCEAGDAEACQLVSSDGAGGEGDGEEGGDAAGAPKERLPTTSAPPRKLADDYIDPGALGIALSFAQANAACGRGDRASCARLDANGFEGRKLLGRMKQGLKQACDLHHMEACVHRGAIDLAERKLDGSSNWLGKGKRIATAAKARCDTGREPNANACARADAVLAKIKTHEGEIATRRQTSH